MAHIIWLSMCENFHSTILFNDGDPEPRIDYDQPMEVPWLRMKELLKPPFHILVHGYKNSTWNIVSAYEEMAKRIYPFAGTIIYLRWPGSVLAITGFSRANARAKTAGMRLAHMIDDLPDGEINVWAHSLGCRVALEATQILPASVLQKTRVILAAPALNNDEVGVEGCFKAVYLESLRVAYSNNDPVLKKAYRWSISPFNWFIHALGETGIKKGVEVPYNYVQQDFSMSVHSHGGYRDISSFYEFGLAGKVPPQTC